MSTPCDAEPAVRLDVHQLNLSSRQSCPNAPRRPICVPKRAATMTCTCSRLARPPVPGTSPRGRLRQVSTCAASIDCLRGTPRRRAAASSSNPPEWWFLSARAVSRRRLERPLSRPTCILKTPRRCALQASGRGGQAPPGCDAPSWCVAPARASSDAVGWPGGRAGGAGGLAAA